LKAPGDESLGSVSGNGQFFFELGLKDDATTFNFGEVRPNINQRLFIASTR
jgi:hypothetical protein